METIPTPDPATVTHLFHVFADGHTVVSGTNAPTFYGAKPLAVITITGTATPSPADITAALVLPLARKVVMDRLATQYATALASGITVTSGTLTVTLAAQLSDQQQFNNLLTLLGTAPMPPVLTIADVHGTPQTVSVSQYYELIGSYGQQIAGLWTSLITARSTVATADTATLAKITLQNPAGQ